MRCPWCYEQVPMIATARLDGGPEARAHARLCPTLKRTRHKINNKEQEQ